MTHKAANIVCRAMRRIIQDDTGGEVLEYALIIGTISITAIVVILSYGNKVVARWSSVNTSM